MLSKKIGITLFLLSLVAFVSATILTLEKLAVLADPNHVLSCSINPFISCGPIMNSWQASLFVIPNSIIGMVGFGLLCLIAITGMIARLPKWYWLATFIGVALALTFIIWLMSQSLFVIGALCIYCMIVWAMTIPLFWLTLANFIQKYNLKKIKFINTYRVSFIIVSYLTVIVIILIRFKDYWATLF